MSALDRLKAFFDTDEWPYEESDSLLITAFSGESGRWTVVGQVRGSAVIVILSIAPLDVATTRLTELAEAVSRANFGLAVGGFDLDYDSGTVQFRTSLDAEGAEDDLDDVLIRHVVYHNVMTMDRYLPALQAVAEGRSAREAIEEIEIGHSS